MLGLSSSHLNYNNRWILNSQNNWKRKTLGTGLTCSLLLAGTFETREKQGNLPRQL